MRVASRHEAGKVTVRERLADLLDSGTSTELDRLATHRATAFGMDRMPARPLPEPSGAWTSTQASRSRGQVLVTIA